MTDNISCPTHSSLEVKLANVQQLKFRKTPVMAIELQLDLNWIST